MPRIRKLRYTGEQDALTWTTDDLARALREDEGQYIEFKQEHEIPSSLSERRLCGLNVVESCYA